MGRRRYVLSYPKDLARIFVPLPWCPKCNGIDLKTTRSCVDESGWKFRRVRCQTCDHAFEIVFQPPAEDFPE